MTDVNNLCTSYCIKLALYLMTNVLECQAAHAELNAKLEDASEKK